MEIWYINLRKSLEIQSSLISSNVLLAVSKHHLAIMRQTELLIFNPIMVGSYSALSKCTGVVQA